MATDQQQPGEPLSIVDFQACNWKTILEKDPEAGYSQISTLLRTAASEKCNESREATMLRLMADTTSMMLTPEDRTAPFKALVSFGDRRSAIPEDFSSDDVDLFAAMACDIEHPLLKARFADLVWMLDRRKGVKFALLAIDAYRASPPCPSTWHIGGRNNWGRALQLALSIGTAAGERIHEIETALLDAFFRAEVDDDYAALWFSGLLHSHGRPFDQRDAIAAHLEELGKAFQGASKHNLARSHFEGAERWFELARKPVKKTEMTAMVAASWEAEADTHNSKLAAMSFYDKALQTFREIPRKSRPLYRVDERLEALTHKIEAAGIDTLEEMRTTHGKPTDISGIMEAARERVRAKDSLQSMSAFAQLYRGPNVDDMRVSAQKIMANSLLQHLFGSSVISAEGRTVVKQPPTIHDPNAKESAVNLQMVRNFMTTIGLVVQGQILPALETMKLEHDWHEWEFTQLVERSPIVPRNRADLVAKGLYAGYCLDFIQAVHLLAPQIENIVRFHLKRLKAITTTTSAEGIVMENGMSTLVKLPEMEKIFGKNLTFELTALYCDQNGPNLRNQMAHGLLDSIDCNSVAGVYAWWLFLRLVVREYWRHNDASELAQDVNSGSLPQASPTVG
ncbi:DUF4209 domain-containing protein [Collimonas fungivorans]|uniref:DUF4209 domain-containing protein n=1 Tax=Collimonas fungivorans TaxID=158899 RepID=UPI003FA3DAF6